LKTTSIVERLGKLGKSTKEKQRLMSIADAYLIWTNLVAKYDALNFTSTSFTLTKDEDLKLVLTQGMSVLKRNIKILEGRMKELGIPLPDKPPEDVRITVDVNAITDRQIYKNIFGGIQGALSMLINAFSHATASRNREMFRQILAEEMDLYDQYREYGKVKGYLTEPPTFRS